MAGDDRGGYPADERPAFLLQRGKGLAEQYGAVGPRLGRVLDRSVALFNAASAVAETASKDPTKHDLVVQASLQARRAHDAAVDTARLARVTGVLNYEVDRRAYQSLSLTDVHRLWLGTEAANEVPDGPVKRFVEAEIEKGSLEVPPELDEFSIFRRWPKGSPDAVIRGIDAEGFPRDARYLRWLRAQTAPLAEAVRWSGQNRAPFAARAAHSKRSDVARAIEAGALGQSQVASGPRAQWVADRLGSDPEAAALAGRRHLDLPPTADELKLDLLDGLDGVVDTVRVHNARIVYVQVPQVFQGWRSASAGWRSTSTDVAEHTGVGHAFIANVTDPRLRQLVDGVTADHVPDELGANILATATRSGGVPTRKCSFVPRHNDGPGDGTGSIQPPGDPAKDPTGSGAALTEPSQPPAQKLAPTSGSTADVPEGSPVQGTNQLSNDRAAEIRSAVSGVVSGGSVPLPTTRVPDQTLVLTRGLGSV